MVGEDHVQVNRLAQMKGYWGPEFEPSVEEITDYQRDKNRIL